jgi:predicted metalloprotease with PDZ domain
MRFRLVALLAVAIPPLAFAQARPARPRAPAPPASATTGPVAIAARYRVRILPGEGTFEIRAEFDLAAARDTVLLSLPAWSPGSYDIDNYARWVHGVRAEADGQPVFWDKADKDTWRVAAGGARRIALEFRTNPDSQMLQFSGIQPNFAFFNGTNLLVYPEGTDFAFPAELSIEAPAGWRLATGLTETGPGRYRADTYHDLVDSPVFAGRLWMDSVVVDRRPIRFAIFPDSAMSPAVWDSVRSTIQALATAQNAIFGGPPYDSYTILFYAPFQDMQWGGGLEHHNSQLDAIAGPFFATNRRTGQLGGFTQPLLSHEFFHLWNVKRIRPAEMWPYDYSREQFTPLLWWSEGVTDYYGDVTLTRAGLWNADRFLRSVGENIQQVENAGETVAVEDASINTWIHPTYVDEAQYYYPKGSLLGLMLDIQIREATNNQHSLDDVMRALWTDYYQRGRGFTTRDLLGIIRPWFAGVDDFYLKYVNGREGLPYVQVLPRGGIGVEAVETRIARVGIQTGEAKDGGVEVLRIFPGSVASEAGLQAGDILVRVGDVAVTDPQAFVGQYRARYGMTEGAPIELAWRRAGAPMTGRSTVRISVERTYRIAPASSAQGIALQIRNAILGQR